MGERSARSRARNGSGTGSANDRLFGPPALFRTLAQEVFPRFSRKDFASIRIWVPGCATGEAVYSLAIALVENADAPTAAIPIQIFGTDADAGAIEHARRGRYSVSVVERLDRTRRQRFFERVGGGYEVCREIRERCAFGIHRVTRDPPFSRLDLLSCNGVLARVDVAARRKLVQQMRQALEPEGLLVTGPLEATAELEDAFTRLDGRGRIGVWKPGRAPLAFTSRPRTRQREAPDAQQALASANENLETAIEELQSANEELDTLNDDLQQRNLELAEARGDLAHLMDSINLGVVLVDRELRVQRFTSLPQREWRLQASDVGRPLGDTRLGVQLPVVEGMASRAASGGRPELREIRDPDGRWHSLQVLPYRSAQGAIAGSVVTLTDVHALKQVQDRFLALVESAPDAMVVVDSSGLIELVNSQAERLFGCAREELVGRTLEGLVPSHPLERRQLARYLKDPRLLPATRWDLVAKRKDGREVPVEVSLSRVETETGTRISATIRDATERLQLEERARRAAVLDERNRLAREVHDNLAQGLTAIVVQLEGAEEVLTSNPQEALRQIVRARDLARHDLDEARRALLALRPGPLDVADLPEAIRGIAEPRDGSVEIAVSVRGRRGRLQPLLEDNLLRIAQEAVSNALRHAGASRVRADLSYASDAFRMRIEDDGCGFEPRRARAGAGLGLSIMRERAERMGAELRIRSGRARGTRVDVRVPLLANGTRG